MSSIKKVRINVTLPPDALEWLRARSEAQGMERGMSAIITRLLHEDKIRQEQKYPRGIPRATPRDDLGCKE